MGSGSGPFAGRSAGPSQRTPGPKYCASDCGPLRGSSRRRRSISAGDAGGAGMQRLGRGGVELAAKRRRARTLTHARVDTQVNAFRAHTGSPRR